MQSYKQFTLTKRVCLAGFLKMGMSVAGIAQELSCSRQTVYRELKRNRDADGEYNCELAHERYRERRKRCVRPYRLAQEPELRVWIESSLKKQHWSPEEIVGRFKLVNPEEHLGHSTIYRALALGILEGCTRESCLRCRGKKRREDREKYNSVKVELSIHDRPKEVESRLEIGHWEGDTIYGGVGMGILYVQVERVSRLVRMELSLKKSPKTCNPAMEAAMKGTRMHTLTLDNGVEFSRYKDIQKQGLKIYFADPHSPWQRGASENTNGRLRYFFQKGFDLRNISRK